MKTEFKKGQVKQIYEFNQEAKNIFDQYMFKNNNLVIGNTVYKGTHFIEQGFILDDDVVQYFDSNVIFKLLKTGRKNITEWEDRDGHYFINDTEFGSCLDEVFNYETECNVLKRYIGLFNGAFSGVNISEEEVYDLMKNNVLTIECDDYKTRISRKLIPGLKKKHELKIRFYPSDNKDIFFMHIRVDRGVLISHHIYQCIKY